MNDSIKKQVISVMLRIVVFIAYYIFLICCGVALIIGAFYATVYSPYVFRLASVSLYFVFGVLIAYLVMWGVVALFAVYLVKPLFAFKWGEHPDRVEIDKSDAPELFQCIADLANAAGCKKPKHVYLTTDVNACVFYNTGFWNIFFPVRKNLMIGLGLFNSTNIEELRSIIGHEFGHFSQNSMKVGSTVYMVNSILYNLVYGNDFYDDWISRLCNSNNQWLRVWGGLTLRLTNIVRRMNVRVYNLVQHAYMGLSRQMEYDADNVACRIVGKETFVSALCKVEVISRFQGLYVQFLQHLDYQGMVIKNYWKGFEIVKSLEGADYSYTFDSNTRLVKPLTVNKFKSRVAVENTWASHPDLDKRIENAMKSETHSSANSVPSWSLIPKELADYMSSFGLESIAQNTDGKKTELIDDDKFRSWVENEIKTYFMPLSVRTFFDRDILNFKSPTDDEMAVKKAYPFTEENDALIGEFEVGLQDWKLLMDIKNHELETSVFTYCGKPYYSADVPLKQQNEYLHGLYDKVEAIDKDVFIYLCQNTEDEDKVRYSYQCLASSNVILKNIGRFTEQREQIIGRWNYSISRGEGVFRLIVILVDRLMVEFQKFMNDNAHWGLLKTLLTEEDYNSLSSFMEKKQLSTNDDLNYVFKVIAFVEDVHRHMERVGKQNLVQIVREALNRNN